MEHHLQHRKTNRFRSLRTKKRWAYYSQKRYSLQQGRSGFRKPPLQCTGSRTFACSLERWYIRRAQNCWWCDRIPGKDYTFFGKPSDFDTFWDGQIASLQKLPKNTKLQREDSGEKEIKYYKLQMDHIKASKIRGQLARPSKGKKLPALLIVQWAGVYPLQKAWAIDKAKKGWLVLNINAHDLPIAEEEAFYKEQANGSLENYPGIGNEDRNTSYFLRMYLSCYRAAQYLTERPDWNGETLVVMGTSQGGLQSLMTAALHPKITASLSLVPAGFDMFGPEVGREPGWPKWYDTIENKDVEKVRETSKYFDIANFVPRITCPVLVGIGLLDEVCPPEGIYASMNQLQTQKEIILLPKSEHQNINGSQEPYYQKAEEEWLPMLMEGERPLLK